MLHRDKLRRLDPDTPETRTLQFLVEERRKFVHEKTRYSNRLTSHLKMYFPQVLEWFDEIGSNIVAEFLERWPDLDKLQRARPATIEAVLHRSQQPKRREHCETPGSDPEISSGNCRCRGDGIKQYRCCGLGGFAQATPRCYCRLRRKDRCPRSSASRLHAHEIAARCGPGVSTATHRRSWQSARSISDRV